MHAAKVFHFTGEQKAILGLNGDLSINVNSEELKEDIAKLTRVFKSNTLAIIEALLLLSSKHLTTFSEMHNTSSYKDLPEDLLEKLQDLPMSRWDEVGITPPKVVNVETFIFVIDDVALEEFRQQPEPVIEDSE